MNPGPPPGPSPAPGVTPGRRPGRRGWLLVLSLLLFVAVALAGLLSEAHRRISTPYQGYESAEAFVEIPQGAGVIAIGRLLARAGVVRDETTFRVAVWKLEAGRLLKAGEYRFSGPLTAEQVVTRLVRGEVFLRTITVPEGLTFQEMGRLFESRGFGPASAFVAAARNGALVTDLDPAARDLEGYLFPETYSLSRTATATDLVAMMVAQFRKVHADLWPGTGETRPLREVITLASLVEKETAVPDERPTVAGVYVNRLRIGMPLQCDPTVIYALAKAGQWNGNLTRANLQVDSPYNTYRFAGLPPGPIANPGRGAVAAALAPRDVDYLYFVSRNDGSHEFAATLAEHNRNVQKFQVQYFRDKRARERAEGAGRGR